MMGDSNIDSDNNSYSSNANLADFEGRIPSSNAENESRKMILESYEKAGVDLPLVTLETVLDREISADDARQSGAPRFRKFLNKASLAMNNRDISRTSSSSTNSSTRNTTNKRQDKIVATALSDASFSPPNTRGSEDEIDLGPTAENIDDEPQQYPAMSNTDDTTQHTLPVASSIPGTISKDTPCHPTFDFCCSKTFATSNNTSTSEFAASDNKYIMSKMQLPEGFDDEYHHQRNLLEEARGSPALMDEENSMLHTTFTDSNDIPSYLSKGGKNNDGLMSYFRKSRRFRWAMVVCCFLHIFLIGLIIAFVKTMDEKTYETGVSMSSSSSSSSSSSTTQDEATTTADLVTSKTLFPDPDLGNEFLDQEPIEEESTGSTSSTTTGTDPITTIDEYEAAIAQQSTNVQVDPTPTTSTPTTTPTQEPSPDPTPCVDSLEVSLNCFGVGSELLIFFESCVPQAGDWVAIYEASEDSQNLYDSDAVGWFYTCGDRFCNQAVSKEVLSFTRAINQAGPGMYRAHLLREGNGPSYSSFANSPEFRVVADGGASCPSK
mmetsp:Transcript_17544/g.38342  ORF Transcript_17544/g.38342 Transcript_17544/m.38342 type:complete len:549 (+) Transcript_17544:209-1855(+)